MANIQMICTSQKSQKITIDGKEVARFNFDGDSGYWNMDTPHIEFDIGYAPYQNKFYDVDDAFKAFKVMVHSVFS